MSQNSNFLNLHILTTAGVSNMNRDDSGSPKQVTYGGVTRHRLSSQALTRPKRIAFETTAAGERVTWRAKTGMIDKALAKVKDLAARSGDPLTEDETTELTKTLTVKITSLVQNKDKAEKAAKERAKKKADAAAMKAAKAAAAGYTAEEVDTLEGGATEDGEGPKDTLVWLAEHELDKLAADALAYLRTGQPLTDFVAKRGRTQSLTIAAFGRMFAFRPDLQNEAAVQRSHAFTTHAADIEPDYFTAVDDLPKESAGAGAGHLDLAQYGGGVFYWHCNIDRAQLWATWIAPTDANATRTQLVDFITALLLAQPNGKQTTAATKTVPDAIFAVPATAPISLHQAFETPVQAGRQGYRQPSVDALVAEHSKVVEFTPRQFPETARYAGTLEPKFDGNSTLTVGSNLDELVDFCVAWLLAGRPSSTEAT
jgi:CRISPR system Cascade subunit CasC